MSAVRLSMPTRPSSSRYRAWVGVLIGLAAAGLLVWQASNAAFTAETSVDGNGWTAGRIALDDDDGGAALFEADNLAAGTSLSRCITVEYGGNVAAEVRMFTSRVEGALANSINVEVTRGAGEDVGCSDFVADGSPLYTGTLTGLGAHSGFATGLPAAAIAPDGKQTFQVTAEIAHGAPMDQTAEADLRWEAHDL